MREPARLFVPEHGGMPRAAILVGAGALALMPAVLGPYDLALLGRFLSLAIAALGLVLLWGHGGLLSLGQGLFFGLGGYALAMHLKLAGTDGAALPDFMVWSGLERLPWWWRPFESPVFALAAVVVLPALVALLLGWSLLRRRVTGPYFAILTQALALAFVTLIIGRQAVTGGFNGLTDFRTFLGVDLPTREARTALHFVTVLLLLAAWLAVRHALQSRYGLALRALRDGENRMRFLGYDPLPWRLAAFVAAAVLAGVGGALHTLHAGVISPAQAGIIFSIELVVLVAVGGRLSPTGAIAGALLVNFARDRISSAFPDLWLYVLGGLFILSVLVLPEGLAGLGQRLRRRP